MASLLQMSPYGGTGDESTKNAVDSVFKEGGAIHLDDFLHKLIAATADGASINFGATEGVNLTDVYFTF